MIGEPQPRDAGQPVLRALILGALPVAVGAAVVLALVPGPAPATLFSQVVIVHDSLLPLRLQPGNPAEAPVPHLLATLSSQLGGRRVESWLYLYGRDRVTVHRIDGSEAPPRNARGLAVGGQDVFLFEVKDLSLLAWSQSGQRMLVVVGACPVKDLREVAAWVLSNGPGPDVLAGRGAATGGGVGAAPGTATGDR